jgi:molybdopterin synthase sulfur carrier subunit
VARLRLFGPAREAAGTSGIELAGEKVSEVITAAEEMFGTTFKEVLRVSSVWLNGENVEGDAAVTDRDEIAVIPPVSGG